MNSIFSKKVTLYLVLVLFQTLASPVYGISCVDVLKKISGTHRSLVLETAIRPPVQRLQLDDINMASDVLAKSFLNDPFMQYALPNPIKRTTMMRWIYERMIVLGDDSGTVLTRKHENNIAGVAIWMHSDNGLDFLDELRVGIAKLPFITSLASTTKILKLDGLLKKWRNKHCQQRCLYLYLIGVDPKFQNLGVARSLIEPAIREAKEKGLPIYLETQNPENIEFYRKFGFEIIEQQILHSQEGHDDIVTYAMIRK